jgi:hypothetical protein
MASGGFCIRPKLLAVNRARLSQSAWRAAEVPAAAQLGFPAPAVERSGHHRWRVGRSRRHSVQNSGRCWRPAGPAVRPYSPGRLVVSRRVRPKWLHWRRRWLDQPAYALHRQQLAPVGRLRALRNHQAALLPLPKAGNPSSRNHACLCSSSNRCESNTAAQEKLRGGTWSQRSHNESRRKY